MWDWSGPDRRNNSLLNLSTYMYIYTHTMNWMSEPRLVLRRRVNHIIVPWRRTARRGRVSFGEDTESLPLEPKPHVGLVLLGLIVVSPLFMVQVHCGRSCSQGSRRHAGLACHEEQKHDSCHVSFFVYGRRKHVWDSG